MREVSMQKTNTKLIKDITKVSGKVKKVENKIRILSFAEGLVAAEELENETVNKK
jgi:hypothetical protein